MLGFLRRRAFRRWPRPAFHCLIILSWFLITRSVAIGSTHLGAAMMTQQKHLEWDWSPGKSDLFPGPPPGAFLRPMVRWDANFYVTLSRVGYNLGNPRPFHVAFFPLYPMMVTALTPLVGDTFRAAFLLSNLCALLAGLVMLRLAAVDGRPHDGLRGALLLLASPGAHFFSYPYPEALFTLLLCLGLLAVASDRPLLAAVPGALAGATRSAGVVISLALLVLAWSNRADFRATAVRILSAFCALAGVAAFAVFCGRRFGDPLAFVHIQQFYGRSITLLGPFRSLVRFTVDPDYFAIALAAIAGGAWMIVKRMPLWMTVSSWFLVLFPMSTGTLKAMIRYQAANVPLLAGVSRMWSGRRFRILLLGCLALMAFEAFLFGKGIGHY